MATEPDPPPAGPEPDDRLYAAFGPDGMIGDGGIYAADHPDRPRESVPITPEERDRIVSAPRGWRWDGARLVAVLVPQAAPVPVSVSRRQLAQALAETGAVTWEEATAWSSGGTLPAALKQPVDGIADVRARSRVILMLGAAASFERTHPMTAMLGKSLGWSGSRLDDLWIYAASLP